MNSQHSSTVLENVCKWISEVINPAERENALMQLSKIRESVPDLAPMLWHSFGTVAVLLQEIGNLYQAITLSNLTPQQCSRVYDTLALLQCLASHPQTRSAFLDARIPDYLYPILRMANTSYLHEHLQLASLSVLGALVKTDEHRAVKTLLEAEIIPTFLKIMKSSAKLSKVAATFILLKILLDDSGLSYICGSPARYTQVVNTLDIMIQYLVNNPSNRLLKHAVHCYLRLADNPDARKALHESLPEPLRNATFASCLQEDMSTKTWLNCLLNKLEISTVGPVGMSLPLPQ